jgi:hypothetical protein
MRSIIFAFALTAIISGCGSPAKMGATDMAMKAVPDMSMPPLNCLQFGVCMFNCFTTVSLQPGQDPFQICGQMCEPMSTAAAVNAWGKAVDCAQNYCEGVNDASVQKCVLNGNQLVDPPGQTNVCDPCINNARGSIFGDFSGMLFVAPNGMCPMASSPDCNGGMECKSVFDACLNMM